ncbi:MAG: YggS family pyridoxal phosphate-dependent enzyme [Hyphomicrobiaceae bacterium]|nr:MAG: YggS family pyridoxal phosphate-dependent enzyme [Hyphomicrobiaceae bacterium]
MPDTASTQNSIEAAKGRLDAVLGRIAAAATAAGRSPSDVRLIAVSKTVPPESIEPLILAGQLTFAENRVQEAKAKWPRLKERHQGLKLHLIGPLQTNKAREAIALFDAIHSIDRPKLARIIAQEMRAQGRRLELFIQVNTGDEEQKAGVALADLDQLIALCRDGLGLAIAGLMCIPPVEEEPALHFALLAKLAARHGLKRLSMGMSADYETAVRFGATDIRIGTALFGPRK